MIHSHKGKFRRTSTLLGALLWALPMAPLAAAGCLAFATGLGSALLVRRRRPARPGGGSRSGP